MFESALCLPCFLLHVTPLPSLQGSVCLQLQLHGVPDGQGLSHLQQVRVTRDALQQPSMAL